MATAIPPNPTSQTINSLLSKLNDPDPDFRFMSLNDILTVLDVGKPDILSNDYNTAARTVDHLVKALDDQNGEVQNLAIKCLGPLVVKLPPQAIGPLIEKLSTMKPKNSVDNTVPSLALRAVISNLPRPVPGTAWGKNVQEAYNPISRVLIPRLLGKTTPASKSPGNVRLPAFGEGLLDPSAMSAEVVDVLIELIHCFGPMLAPYEVEALHDGVLSMLDSDQPGFSAKKRAVVAISILAVYISDPVLESFVKRTESILGNPKVTRTTRRLYITILGSMARSIPHRFGRYLDGLAPFILSCLGEDELQQHLELVSDGADAGASEFNEIRESALVALESFLASCPIEMRPFTDDAITASLRYLKFDPNYAANDDDDEDMDEDDEDDEDGLDEDDEFDTAYGFEDDDDASWKVRRCAAKVIYTLIATRSNGDLLDNGVLYKAANSLVKRFDEREENVRLEIISALSLLVRKTGEGIIPELSLDATQGELLSQLPASRKRRRQSSGGASSAYMISMSSPALSGSGLTSPILEKVPASGPRADLAKLTPTIVKAGTKLLKGRHLATKQAVIKLFDDIISVQSGGLSSYLDQIMGPVLDAIKPSTLSGSSASLLTSGGNASATPVTLRVTALRLMSDIAKTHSSQLLQPYLTKVVSCVVAVVKDRFYKISAEAIQTVEELAKAITPPRSRKTAGKFKGELRKLYDVVIDRTIANDADAEVRQKAIHALGTLLARTSSEAGSDLLPASERTIALQYLLERLKNETTRLSAVRAIDAVAASSSRDVVFEPNWIRQVVVGLSSQLRKANRSLRGSSVQALSHLTRALSARQQLDDATITALVADLQPVITNNDAHLLSPALNVLADLVQKSPQLVMTPQTNSVLIELLKSPAAASVLDSLLVLVTRVGEGGVGGPLMNGVLQDVGINGDPAVVGKVIGNLLVASGDSAGVGLDSFIVEVETSNSDQARASLALTVLGEAGLRLGTKSPLSPKIFLSQFGTEFDKVTISAAVALGRAGAGDVAQYLPIILEGIEKPGSKQYLLLQSVKEILQQVSVSDQIDISPYSEAIWNHLLRACTTEDNKAVCAECIGRLAIITPQTFVPKLQDLLQDKSSTLRAIAVQALRYTLPESGDVFDAIIKEHLVGMLVVMLQDKHLEIRRLAMTTLNSAAHNKPDLILSQLGQLLPYVMKESVKNDALIREVQMGPFKHLVDDGLEVRKSAYETLYALMETAFSRLDVIQLYDRIIDGLSDENDIRALCNLMVSKLVFLAPEETTRRLDDIATAFRRTLSTRLKENAVKQDIEKMNEANKSVLRVSLLLGDKLKASLASAGSAGGVVASQNWLAYWDGIAKEHGPALKELREENITFKEMGGQPLV